MTHTLHRRGNEESLREDYIMLIMPAKGFNEDGAHEKMQAIWDLLSKFRSDIINFGNITTGNSHTTGMAVLKKTGGRMIHAVFKDKKILRDCLKALKDQDFGLSVVISGLYTEVENICAEIGLSPHTVEYSLGIHGNRKKLPAENVLEITTMCGHALVSPNLVLHLIDEIKEGNITCKSAAKELSKGCACGIFNDDRAEKLLESITAQNK